MVEEGVLLMGAFDEWGGSVTLRTLEYNPGAIPPPNTMYVDLDRWDVERVVVRTGGTEHAYDTAALVTALDRIAKEEEWTSVPRVCR